MRKKETGRRRYLGHFGNTTKTTKIVILWCAPAQLFLPSRAIWFSRSHSKNSADQCCLKKSLLVTNLYLMMHTCISLSKSPNTMDTSPFMCDHTMRNHVLPLSTIQPFLLSFFVGSFVDHFFFHYYAGELGYRKSFSIMELYGCVLFASYMTSTPSYISNGTSR